MSEVVEDLEECRELLQEIGVVSFDRSYLLTSVKTLVLCRQQSRDAGESRPGGRESASVSLKSVHEDEFNTIS